MSALLDSFHKLVPFIPLFSKFSFVRSDTRRHFFNKPLTTTNALSHIVKFASLFSIPLITSSRRTTAQNLQPSSRYRERFRIGIGAIAERQAY